MATLVNRTWLNELTSTLPNRRSRPYIQWVQQSLNKILRAKLVVDGKIGPQTRNVIRDFQRQKGLKIDGAVGPVTEQALIAAGAGRPPSGPAPTPVPGPLPPAPSADGFVPVAVENPGGGRVKDKRIPTPVELVTVTGVGGRKIPLHPLAARALLALQQAARQDGLAAPLLLPTSGFRSPQRQKVLWEKALNDYHSAEKAKKWVGRPGHSAHQTGRAVDLYLGGKGGSANVENLRRLPAYHWLVRNAVRFGFYPYEEEPWHWEYNPPARADIGRQPSPDLPTSIPTIPAAPASTPSADEFVPVAVENPGGGRVKDKRDPNPADVVNVRGASGQVPLHRLAARAWEAMVAAARSAGLNDPLLLPTSGYRSSQHQRELWEAALKRYGSAEVARKWVAPPGSSAHQSGRAMDLYLGGKNDSSNVDNLRRLPAYRWMVANAERFGFYPYGNEPWHWEYNPPARAGSAPPPASTSPSLPGSTTPGPPAPPTPKPGGTAPKALPVAFETPISCENSPYAWAREVRRKMQTWWSDQDLRRVNGRWQAVANVPVGSALRQMVPQAFPGTPPQVFMGFCANGSVRGNTTECASETCRKQAFHEIGLFGTEAGLRSRPAPDPNPGGEYNSWGRLAGTDLVRRLLGGRSATMQPGAWKTSIPDQVAVGLANLLDHGHKVSALLDPSIRPSGPGSLWFVAMCFMGWSAGDGRTAKRHINPLSSTLAAVPESRRWGEFLRLAADGIRSGRLDLRGKRKHNSIAWSALRTWQKLAAGQLLASQTGGNQAWFDPGLGNAEGEIARVITCAARSAR